tara:strand:+ start:346 stop:744 length:399 start_codon:yes stop_codon:yes gene_type:complete
MKITKRQLKQIIRESLNEKKCWDGYSPGAKSGKKTKISSKTGKRVNNCEKISELDESEEKVDELNESKLRILISRILEACYDGRKVTLNKKMSNPENKNKKSKVYVSGDGKYKSGSCKGQNKAKKFNLVTQI